MRIDLTEHPDTPCPTVVYIEATVRRPTRDLITLRYYIWGDIEIIVLPVATGSHDRADDLWKHTCFEAFLSSGEGGYHEINLSSSGQWATYSFDGYRTGMKLEERLVVVDITTSRDEHHFLLEATVNIDGLPIAQIDGDVRLGLSVVIDVVDEEGIWKSYFALAHPPGKPDFHHPDAFAAVLPDLEPS